MKAPMKRLHPPTERQREIMTLIADITARSAQPPSANQLAKELGITHRGVRKALASMAEHGWLADIPIEVSSGKWRVTSEGKRWLPQKGLSSSGKS